MLVTKINIKEANLWLILVIHLQSSMPPYKRRNNIDIHFLPISVQIKKYGKHVIVRHEESYESLTHSWQQLWSIATQYAWSWNFNQDIFFLISNTASQINFIHFSLSKSSIAFWDYEMVPNMCSDVFMLY